MNVFLTLVNLALMLLIWFLCYLVLILVMNVNMNLVRVMTVACYDLFNLDLLVWAVPMFVVNMVLVLVMYGSDAFSDC